MYNKRHDLLRFLKDIRERNYSKDYTSFHSSNMMMQEGILEYEVDLEDSITCLILDAFIKSDAFPVENFNKIIDDLILEIEQSDQIEEIRILFLFYQQEIRGLFKKRDLGKVNGDQLRAALRKFCKSNNDFDKMNDYILEN